MNRLEALWQTAIGKKVAMAVSGLALVGFLVSHMASNVLIFVDPAKLDHYAEWLRSFGALLWVARAGLLAMVGIHILHFTTGTLHPDFYPGEVGRNLISGMQVQWTAAFYAVTMVAIGAHFWHGIWSVFQTLGLNHPAWNRTRTSIAVGLTLLVAGGFLSIPLAALFGLLR